MRGLQEERNYTRKHVRDSFRQARSECESFQYLSDFEKDRLRSIVLKKSLKGVKFFYDWDNEDGDNRTWNSFVLSQSTRKKTGLVLINWVQTYQIHKISSWIKWFYRG